MTVLTLLLVVLEPAGAELRRTGVPQGGGEREPPHHHSYMEGSLDHLSRLFLGVLEAPGVPGDQHEQRDRTKSETKSDRIVNIYTLRFPVGSTC